ncbi:MAG: argininosuccinate lyase [Ferruginibacter sp.]
MKLWQKNTDVNNAVENFTVGRDRDFDAALAPFDVLGSIAHAIMLETAGMLSIEEKDNLVKVLREIYDEVNQPGFVVDKNMEDIHSQVENMLTQKLGDTGKKIHAARSRNDQVLLDVKLFLRHAVFQLVYRVKTVFNILQENSEKYKEHYLPGYTHLQMAMPSSFGLWFGAYAESLADDVLCLQSAYKIINKNPLGSAAGYGSSFPINRTLTTELLGFDAMNYNVVYAQMGRGKAERVTAQALANVADTLARFSMDACLYLNQQFGFISFPDTLTTGSSIMPHKKNPDVFELIRAHCNRVKALPNEITMLTTNLPSGYHRDYQLLKEQLFPAFDTLHRCLDMMELMLENISVKENILADDAYKYIFSVEEVNRLSNEGITFRDAYRQVGADIENGNFSPSRDLHHTHEGSMHNLQTAAIAGLMKDAIVGFNFSKAEKALQNLLL